ncbi:MAG TPA: alanine--tRNA ligase, partial [Puia sp.]|nr:alanine--tRNA ligase [Puia sp.]
QPLPARHVDTGMGFERLVRVLQGKHSNYDTDVFTGTIAGIGNIVGRSYKGDDTKASIAFRVIADHIRAIGFTIADGQLPANTDAGYVIRRILRRAVRYYYSYLEYRQPLLYQLMPLLAAQFKDVFPELQQQVGFVSKVVREEEEAFLRTLEKGLKRIEEVMKVSAAGGVMPGAAAFELYDTYGFPEDLTRLIAAENNLTVDGAGFQLEMQRQKDRSRAATAIDATDWVVLIDNPLTEFVGYDLLETRTRIAKYRKITAKGKESWQIVLEATPFYAESGGQEGDTGILVSGGETIPVLDTKKENDLIIHFTGVLPAGLNGPVIARVDAAKRKRTEVHHSATHLLHAALRAVLGSHVAQKGSLVNDEQLRFDFSHFARMTEGEIAAVEEMVNAKIRENIPVVTREMPKAEALRLGAMALFGEKYGDTVRVVIIDPTYSIELCGGTHVGATGELGLFKIWHESAVAAGVRRIEAVSGKAAEEWVGEQLAVARSAREVLKNPADLPKAIENLVAENGDLRKKLEKAEARQLADLRGRLLDKVKAIGGVSFIGEIVDVPAADALKRLSFELKPALSALSGAPPYLVVLAANIEGKAAVSVMLDERLAAGRGLQAPSIIKEQVAPLIRGGGGGQKTLATAGGQEAGNLSQVIEKVEALLK